MTLFEMACLSECCTVVNYFYLQAAQQQILVCKSKVRQYEQRAKKQFKGMFEKLSKVR